MQMWVLGCFIFELWTFMSALAVFTLQASTHKASAVTLKYDAAQLET
jgi:hypothetical protein